MNAVVEQVANPLAPSRDQILALQEYMRQFDQIDCPLVHTFAPGAYARTITLPTGSLVVGKIHKHAHLNIISKGRVTVVTEFGRSEMSGPYVFTSKPGTKRAVYTHEECIWTTVHLSDETDLEKIEDQIIAKTYDELPPAIAADCIELLENVK